MISTEICRPADLFFTTSHSFISWAIRQRTWGEYSHVAVIVGEERGKLVVVSADMEGVMCRGVRESELDHHAILTYPEMTEDERKAVVRFCYSQIGKLYDFMGLGSFLLYKELQNDERWYCSEIAYVAYKSAGVRLVRRVKQDFVSPRDLYISPLLKPLEGNNTKEVAFNDFQENETEDGWVVHDGSIFGDWVDGVGC